MSSKKRSREDKYDDYAIVDPEKIPEGPDALVDIPVVKVDSIEIKVEDLRAQVAVQAEVKDLVQINVGAAALLGEVDLQIKGVEAQALLKARLHNVQNILSRVLLTLDRNPEILSSIGEAVEDVGSGAQQTLSGAGSAVQDVGQGAGQALPQIGQGANQGLQAVGEGANQGLQGVGQGANQGVQGVGEGANQGLQGAGQGAGQGLQGVGKGAGGN